MNSRALIRAAGMAALAAVLSASAPPESAQPNGSAVRVTVFKDPNCGCCKDWVSHLRAHGFEVVAHDTSDVSGAKRTGRVPQQLYSCHTAFVNGYVIEGHVPAEDIDRLLRSKAKVAGLAVPGMPAGSPGMEGSRKDSYDVVAFNRDGSTRVYSHH